MLPSHFIRHPAITILVAGYLALAVVYSVVVPLFESPDEVWHYEYVRWLAAGEGLAAPEDVGVAPFAQEGSQPPLYYLLGAAATAWVPTDNAAAVIRYNMHTAVGDAEAPGNKNYLLHGRSHDWPWRGVTLAAHLARLLSVLLGAATVLFTWLIARAALPGWPAAAWLATAFVAFSPQFLFISASVNNDNLVTLLATVGVYLCVRLTVAASPPRAWTWIALGGVVGLAALSKLSGLLLVAPVAFTILLVARRARAWRVLWAGGLLVGFTAVAVAGWWYVRNWLLFGDPLLLSVMFAGVPPQGELASVAELLALAPGVWRSTWAVFGWFNVLAPPWLTWLYTLLALLALAGWGVGWIGRWSGRRRDLGAAVRPAALALLAGWLALVGLAVVRWAQISYAQGRLIFPALAALAATLAGGLLALTPARWQRSVSGLLVIMLAVIAGVAPFAWILPAYPPPPLAAAGAEVPSQIGAAYAAGATLLGATLDRTEARAGDAIEVTLYWRADAPLATDASVFVHAVDAGGIVQAQHDSHPGLGSYPTSEWQPGQVIVDRHALIIPAGAPAPAALRIVAGLYDAATGQRLPSAQGDAAGVSDTVTLGEVLVLSDADALPGATRIDFDGKLALVGFELGTRTLRPGDSLDVTLWWEALSPMTQDYVVFVHLLLPPDAVWAQRDQMPQAGAARTSTWQVGERIEDAYTLALPLEAPPGVYRIEIGVYDRDSFERLPVSFSDQGVVLAQVKVE